MKKKTEKTVATEGNVKKDDEEQSRRFVETAKELDADESGMHFDNLVEKLKTEE